MEEKNEKEREKGEKLNFEVCLRSFTCMKVMTSVTHVSIYSLGHYLNESFLEKLELSYTHPSNR